MALSYHELVALAKREIREITPAQLATGGTAPPLLIDVREPNEYQAGTIAGAVLVPRGLLGASIGGRGASVAPPPPTPTPRAAPRRCCPAAPTPGRTRWRA